MDIGKNDTALLVTDAQNHFLSEKEVTCQLVGDNVKENRTVENIGPENNGLILQLRKRNISKVILGGMSANLCVEAHMRELLELGFEVAVVKDATAGARHPELGDGYKAELVNFGYMANAILSTDDAVKAMGR